MEQIQEQLLQLASIIITGCISIACVYVAIYFSKLKTKIQAETNKIEDESIRNIVNSTLGQVQDLVFKNVVAVEQTSKKVILDSISDGKITKEELLTLKDEVYKNVIEQMNEDSLAIITSQFDNVNSYINVLIENELARLKGQVELGGVSNAEYQEMVETLNQYR